PYINRDLLPAHPATRLWATSNGRPPMAVLEPPPPSNAVTHIAELQAKLAEVASKAYADSQPVEDSDPRAALARPTLQRVDSPPIFLPPQDPSAHPGFDSVPFWVPPRRDLPALVNRRSSPKACSQSQESSRN
ncbi:hypothetical protein EV714DRAFT_172179, partial [Schizophyllum commune]